MLDLILALTLATPFAPPETPPALAADETEVSELLVVASREGRDPSNVATECVWRELPAGERAALTREAEQSFAALGRTPRRRLNRKVVTETGVAGALAACGAPADETVVPFARIAVVFYGTERAATAALSARGLSPERLAGAWGALPENDRETLALQAGRLARGSDGDAQSAALIVFGLVRRLRPLSAFNPLAYKGGSVNHQIVAHYAPRAVRHAMEKRF